MDAHTLILYGRQRRFFFSIPPDADLSVGRALENSIRVADVSASRKHCQLLGQPGGYVLEDFGSANGTYLNQRRIEGKVGLTPGDVIRIGSTYLRFLEIPPRAGSKETLRRRLRLQNRMPGLAYCDRCDRRFSEEAVRYNVPHPDGVLVVCDACYGQDALIGKTIAGYRIQESISRGGSGRIYKAEQVSMRRLVALKVLDDRLANDEESVARFLREARSAGKLTHPSIVQLYDCGFTDGHYFIAMEYVPGHTLDEVVSKSGPFPIPRAIRYLHLLADALAFAFRYQIIHRDIKPENIILAEDDMPKVLDFGLAKDLGESSHGVITDSGTGLGTPEYMPAEQLEDAKAADQRADIYMLGGTFFFMLTGRPPIRGKTILEIIQKIRGDKKGSLRQTSPSTPAAVCVLYEKMTQHLPADRYQNPNDLLKAIEGVERELGIPPPTQNVP
ncbi:MAG: FHA domain-containing serine/threonine-protein kinase [Planctomycetota bacterium]